MYDQIREEAINDKRSFTAAFVPVVVVRVLVHVSSPLSTGLLVNFGDIYVLLVHCCPSLR